MAMYIVLSDKHEIERHYSEPMPEIWQPKNPSLPRRQVLEIQADGDELDEVRFWLHLPHVISASKRVVQWFGEEARIIFENLKVRHEEARSL